VNIALIVLTSINGLTALLGAVFGLALMFDLRSIVSLNRVNIRKDSQGNINGVTIAQSKQSSFARARRNQRKVDQYTYMGNEEEKEEQEEEETTAEAEFHPARSETDMSTINTRSSAQLTINQYGIPNLKNL